jgi:hypothetical protein
MAQRLPDQFEVVERSDGSQNMGRIRPLASARLEPAAVLTPLQQRVQQHLFETALDQAGAKLAQRRVMESLVAQFQAKGILPVNPGTRRVRRLPVTQVLERTASRSPSPVATDGGRVALRWHRLG